MDSINDIGSGGHVQVNGKRFLLTADHPNHEQMINTKQIGLFTSPWTPSSLMIRDPTAIYPKFKTAKKPLLCSNHATSMRRWIDGWIDGWMDE